MIVKFTAVRDFHLTRNQDYTVIRETANQYVVRNDRNIAAGYDKRLFEIVDNGNTDTITQETDQPQPARRRGRPTNAEIAAREQQATQPVQQVPVENAAQRRAREAREAEERLAQQRADEERRRGRVRTEQDIADSIDVRRNNNTYTVTIDFKERLNDQPSITSRSFNHQTTSMDSLSCGINQLTSMQDFMNSIHNMLNYQNSDYEVVREELFRKVGEAFINNDDRRNAGYEIASVTRNTIWIKEMLVNYFGFSELLADTNNPNSGNNICLLGRLR